MALKYKVGDRVRIKSLDWYNENVTEYDEVPCGSTDFIPDMTNYCDKIVTISKVLQGLKVYRIQEDNETFNWTDEMIEGLVEEESLTPPLKHPEDSALAMLFHKTLILPEGYQFVDENGNVINATKIVLEKKKKEYPKTYEECRDYIESCYDKPFCADLIATGYKSKLIESFARLLICRDAYWKIAGEEMGLGKPWEPDWNDGELKWCMSYSGNYTEFDQYKSKHHTLAFPTEEMRDAFYENFKSEIESCKELL